MTCVQCGMTIMEAENDKDGYFVLNRITPTEDVDYHFCGSACLVAFIEEATNG